MQKDLSIVLCGEAGQGIQTVEHLLTRVLKFSGYNVFATKEFMSRIRGGYNSTTIRVASDRVAAFIDRMDFLIPFSEGAIKHVEKRISSKTIIFADKKKISTTHDFIDIPFAKIASNIGGSIYANIVGVGLISGILKLDQNILYSYLKQYFSAKGGDIIQKNIDAVNKGYEIGTDLLRSGKIEIEINADSQVSNDILLNGTEAVALGAIAGGCNFISAYPMTPATGVFTFIAQHSKDFDIIIEQAEDEISAMNMAIGAWYAGARAMVTTSGGGFDLMTEGLSLAGNQETPMVIHLSQRPGPATGLPTRTEQADLELALYAGHGEFPRIILAPGKIEDALYLTQKAFNLADKYQVPVFILTDQYFVDSYYNLPSVDLSNLKIDKYIVKTKKGYKRYRLTENGISPRGVPGFGEEILSADCHMHDEEGHISENLGLRTKMVNKFLKKMELIKKDVIPLELIGNEDYRTLVICWGSNYNVVNEAIKKLERDDVSFLHYKQVYPLHPDTLNYLRSAKDIVIVENNATSQFGKLIKLYTGIDIEKKILKYNGLPFSVEEIVKKLKKYTLS